MKYMNEFYDNYISTLKSIITYKDGLQTGLGTTTAFPHADECTADQTNRGVFGNFVADTTLSLVVKHEQLVVNLG